MTSNQGQVVARGAFQLFGSEQSQKVSELLGEIFGRDDVRALGCDWRGIVYFTLADDEEVDADTVIGFDPSSGNSGDLATIDEVLEAVRSGEIAEAVDVESFDAWRTATDVQDLGMGQCVPPTMPEFLGGDPAERAVEPEDVISFIAANAALMGRLEELGVQPGDEVPDELFDESRW